MFMCGKLNLSFDREIKVYCVKLVLKHGINFKTMCPNYILDFRNTKSHLFQFNIGLSAKTPKIMSV